MDGVSEDFSGLPEYKTRSEKREERVEKIWSERRSDPYRGRRTRVLVVGGFVIGLALMGLAAIAFFAPTPYLGMSHDALASSVGHTTSRGCHPSGDGWLCTTSDGGSTVTYKVKVDWAGCWTGRPVGPTVARGEAQPAISGCVSIMDHLTAG
jgi:hypothetical protein